MMRRAYLTIIGLALLSASPASASMRSELQTAIHHGQRAVEALELRAAHQGQGPALLAAMYRVAPPHLVVTGEAASTARIRPGCRRTSHVKAEVRFLFGIDYGWEQVTQHGFCWNGRRITWSGGESTRRWASPVNCWTNTDDSNHWTAYPKWQRAEASGQLGGGFHGACAGLQQVHVWIDYANGGGLWRHHN